jgi:site-specific recombinase XerD
VHRLRHTAASTVLASGASLGEIGGALRERSTVIYAKVDRTRLAELARQWPGSGR